jgi:hypothetical protein
MLSYLFEAYIIRSLAYENIVSLVPKLCLGMPVGQALLDRVILPSHLEMKSHKY